MIHKFQVPQSMDFNESYSAVENVVVITGKLISLPYGFESRSEFWKLLSAVLFSAAVFLTLPPPSPPQASTPYSLSASWFYLFGLPSQDPTKFFLKSDVDAQSFQGVIAVPRTSHDIASFSWPTCQKENKGVLFYPSRTWLKEDSD